MKRLISIGFLLGLTIAGLPAAETAPVEPFPRNLRDRKSVV